MGDVKKSQSFKLKDIVRSHGWRKKWWRHAQLSHFTISEEHTEDTPSDPSYLLTQSGKNYQYVDSLLPYFSQPDQWQLVSNSLGVGWKLHTQDPISEVYGNFRSQQWHRAARFGYLFYKIPGVKKVYVVGSLPLDISTEQSDIDFAIKTSPYTPLVSRFWIKILLKILRKDVHPLWLSFSKINQRYKLEEISKHKLKSPGIDVGLIYDSEDAITHHYGMHPRHMWLHIKTLIVRKPHETQTEEVTYFWKQQSVVVDSICKCILSVCSIPLIPLILCQLLLKNNDHINNKISLRFINYYPLSGHPTSASLVRYQ